MFKKNKSKASLSKQLIDKIKKDNDFHYLPDYERFILQAECLELRASKLLKYASNLRKKACDILLKAQGG